MKRLTKAAVGLNETLGNPTDISCHTEQTAEVLTLGCRSRRSALMNLGITAIARASTPRHSSKAAELGKLVHKGAVITSGAA